MSLPSSPFKADGNRKSFWERPEGGLGIGVLAALALGAFALIKVFGGVLLGTLDTAIALVGKTMALGGLIGILALVLLIAFNPKVHALIGYAFKLSMRWAMGQIIELDPIGIMRIYIDDLKKRLATIDERLGNLAGQIRAVKETIRRNKEGVETALQTAQAANQMGKQVAFGVNAKQADRLGKANLRYEDVLKKMEFLHTMLKKYREASEGMILDLTNEVSVQEVERKSMLAAYGAMTAVRDILNGNGDKREMFDQAMEFTINDYGMKIGEIENFMDTSQSFIESLDLSNATANAAALEKLQEWENKAGSLLLGNAKEQALQSLGAVPVQVQPVEVSYLSHKR